MVRGTCGILNEEYNEKGLRVVSYQALYRVWRPQKFADLVGQELITQTLKNALKTKQTSHAYLFCGPRGTGKTSAAKIFAKAINCHHQVDGEPCNQCEICQAITNGQLGDVIEIDAASNNGVEEIRDVRDKVKYAPTVADYKVYIIDEVHMLSKGAFNALLKTLEEPPANVVFILATTEPHKIPATIISRTQRFDFKRITPQVILKRMEYILQQKEVTAEPDALKVIAKAAEGGMRDALSILDQVLSYGDGHSVTLDNALLVTGAASRKQLTEYVQHVAEHATAAALASVEALLQAGKDASRIIEDVINYCRDLLLYQQDEQLVTQSELTVFDDDFKQLAQTLSSEQLTRFIKILNEQQENMRFSVHPSIYLEVVTIQLCNATPAQPAAAQPTPQPVAAQPTAADPNVAALVSQVTELKRQVAALQEQVKHGGTPAAQPAQPQPKRRQATQTYDLKLNQINQVLAAAKRSYLVQLKEVWHDFITMLNVSQRALFRFSTPVAVSADAIVVSMQFPFLCAKAMADEQLNQTVTADLEQLIGTKYHLYYVWGEDWEKLRRSYLKKHFPQKAAGAQPEPQNDATPAAPADQSETTDETAQQAAAGSQAAPSDEATSEPAAATAQSETTESVTEQPTAGSQAASSDETTSEPATATTQSETTDEAAEQAAGSQATSQAVAQSETAEQPVVAAALSMFGADNVTVTDD